MQAVGVAGDLWCWIKGYLANRSQATVVNGFQFETLPVKFGMPQGSVLRPTLFSLICNDLPDIAEYCDGRIQMYADNTKIYVVASSPDMVAVVLNVILLKLYDWCCLTGLIPYPGKIRVPDFNARPVCWAAASSVIEEQCCHSSQVNWVFRH